MSENQLKEAKQMVEESDIKYDEVARKLAMVEGDLERAEERAEAGESKIVDLEEELRVIGENLKALEVAEEKAQQREEEYKKQVCFKTAVSQTETHFLTCNNTCEKGYRMTRLKITTTFSRSKP